MSRIRKYLASILVITISASLSFSSNAIADSGRAIKHKSGEKGEESVETQKSALGIFAYPSTTFIVASTAGIGVFTALISYWCLARNQGQPNNGAQNAGLAIMGAVVQAVLPEHHEVDRGLGTLDQQATLSLDVFLEQEQSEGDLQTQSSKEDEATDQAVLEQVVEKPKRRAIKAIAGSRELLESAQRFLGNNDYSAPRASRFKRNENSKK